MIDWVNWVMGILQGTIVSVFGGVLIFYYFIPKMTKNTTKRTIEELKKDPEFKPVIDKAKEIIDKIHPLVNQFKNLDLEKTQNDFKPLIEGIKKIDPKEVEGLIKNLKDLTKAIKGAIEKPNIPPPPD